MSSFLPVRDGESKALNQGLGKTLDAPSNRFGFSKSSLDVPSHMDVMCFPADCCWEK